MKRVVVTGLGAISPLGLGARLSWTRLLDGQCGITSLDQRGEAFQKLQSRVAGLVPQGCRQDGGWTSSEWLTRDEERRMAKFAQYGVVAASEALRDAGWYLRNASEQEDTGVCFGSGIGAFEDVYDTSLAFAQGGAKKVSPLFVPRLLINLAAGHISMKYRLKGPNHSPTTACTTGAHALTDAYRLLALGDSKVVVAGASESTIHPLALTAFERSRSLCTTHNHAPHSSSRPFHSTRSGFVMAEGAAALILEDLDHALARRAPQIYAELAGYGATADAHHMTHPPTDGEGAFRAMLRAIQMAGIGPEEVDYINAHATSTPLGDAAEAEAIRQLLCSGNDREEADITVSSTKGATGHLLGASGALEALFTVLSVAQDIVPPTLNLAFTEKDPSLPNFNYVPGDKAQRRKVDVALSNSFGFGGTNASLCFKKYQG